MNGSKIRIVVEVRDGDVQDVYTDSGEEVVAQVVNYDVEELEREYVQVLDGDECCISHLTASQDPVMVEGVFNAFGKKWLIGGG